MWFKNLQLYRLPSPWTIDLVEFDERLGKRPFQRCGSQDQASRGFVSPNRSDARVLASNQQWLIALRTVIGLNCMNGRTLDIDLGNGHFLHCSLKRAVGPTNI